MSVTYTVLDAALKEGWTQESLEDQLVLDDAVLKQMERSKPTDVLGRKAFTSVRIGLGGGYSAIPLGGTKSYNDAGAVDLDQAEWELSRHIVAMEWEYAAIQRTKKPKAIANAVDVEVQAKTELMRQQLTRQLFSAGDALIAKCGTTSNSTTIKLDPAGMGYHAIRSGWLHEGLLVDIGTTADEDSIAGGVEITAVNEDASAPTITVSGSGVNTSGSNFVSIKDARAGTTSYEAYGLKNIVNTGAFGSITHDRWESIVDSSVTELVLEDLWGASRRVRQRSNKMPDWVVTSPLQKERIYGLHQAQVRFSDDSVKSGNVDNLSIRGVKIDDHPDCPDSDLFFLRKEHFVCLRPEAPYFLPEKMGGKRIEWVQGGTYYTSALAYDVNFVCNRRNVHMRFDSLT